MIVKNCVRRFENNTTSQTELQVAGHVSIIMNPKHFALVRQFKRHLISMKLGKSKEDAHAHVEKLEKK